MDAKKPTVTHGPDGLLPHPVDAEVAKYLGKPDQGISYLQEIKEKILSHGIPLYYRAITMAMSSKRADHMANGLRALNQAENRVLGSIVPSEGSVPSVHFLVLPPGSTVAADGRVIEIGAPLPVVVDGENVHDTP